MSKRGGMGNEEGLWEELELAERAGVSALTTAEDVPGTESVAVVTGGPDTLTIAILSVSFALVTAGTWVGVVISIDSTASGVAMSFETTASGVTVSGDLTSAVSWSIAS